LACENIKILLKDYQKALKDLDKANVLKPNNTFTLTNHGNVKIMLEDYHRSLEDVDKAYVIKPNTIFVLIVHAHINWGLNKYQVALETMDKLHLLEPIDWFILQARNWLKWMLVKYQLIIELLACNLNIQSFTYNDFNFQIFLGKGAFGKVYESQWKGIKIVVKSLKMECLHFFLL
jgi:tetratricopeptide (TPR) repeat protein